MIVDILMLLWLLKQNVHPLVVSQRSGHASIQITPDIYSHIAPGIPEVAAARLDELLIPKEKTPVA